MLVRLEVGVAKDAVFTMKLEAGLRDEFMSEANAVHRPASQVMRDLMREFVERQRERREHGDFVKRKVDVARSAVRANLGRFNEEVEADFAVRRARASQQSASQ